MKKALKAVLLLGALLMAGCGVTSESLFPAVEIWTPKTRDVRVALNLKAAQAKVSVEGEGSFYSQSSGAYLGRFKGLNGAVVTAREGYVALNGKVGQGSARVSRIMIVPDNAAPITLDGSRYRGQLEFIASGSQLVIVNHLGLEDYLCGVIPKETFPSWPRAALRAQAIASRSYALAKCQSTAGRDYDLTAPGDQLYGGMSAETPTTTAAVYDTAGQYLVWEGAPLLTFFHTCCGGATEDGEKIFSNVKTYPKGVVSPYCKDCKHYSWEYRISASEMGSKLAASGRKTGSVKQVAIVSSFKSARAAEVRIQGASGTVTLTGEQLRQALGYNVLKSTRLTVAAAGGDWLFQGRGWGHGVGMCQWCSEAMARSGMGEEQILKHFYPGAELR